MRTVIAGGHGKVGLRLGALLAQRGDQPVGLVRAPEQAPDLEAAGVEPLVLDLVAATPQQLAGALQGADAVVFSAGAGGRGGPEATNAIDGEAAVRLVDAASAAGVRRFVLVSVFMDAGRGGQVSDTFENYMRVKRAVRRPPRRQRPGLDHPAPGHAHRRPRHRHGAPRAGHRLRRRPP